MCRAIYTLQRRPDTDIPLRLAITLEPVKSRRVVHDRNAHPLRFDLPDRSREPFPRPQKPAAECPQGDDADGNGRVVECLAVDRVELGETEDDGDEADVQACDGGDGP